MIKDVKNYEGLYKVRDDGTIWSIDRYNIDKNGKRKFYPSRVLSVSKQIRNHTTYHAGTLSKEGRTKRFLLHRLVAETFIPNPDKKLLVNHIDNNGENNNVSNLEWCTHQENMMHAQKQGRLFKAQSAGGKASSLVQEARTREVSDTYLGKTINNWKILTYAPPRFRKDGKKGKYVKAQCCECMTIHEVYLSTIVNNYSKQCNRCGSRKAIAERTKRKIAEVTGKVYNNLKVLSESHRRPSDNCLIMNVECIYCNNKLKKDINLLINKKTRCNKYKTCKG